MKRVKDEERKLSIEPEQFWVSCSCRWVMSILTNDKDSSVKSTMNVHKLAQMTLQKQEGETTQNEGKLV